MSQIMLVKFWFKGEGVDCVIEYFAGLKEGDLRSYCQNGVLGEVWNLNKCVHLKVLFNIILPKSIL